MKDIKVRFILPCKSPYSCDNGERDWHYDSLWFSLWEGRLLERERKTERETLIMARPRLDARFKVTVDKSSIIYSLRAGVFLFFFSGREH